MDWTQSEVKLIVEDYFKMLDAELANQKFNKSEHRNMLLPFLEGRNKGSVEFKHQNISAALANMGYPFIKGYKPRYNYQQLLEQEVVRFIHDNMFNFEQQFERFAVDAASAKTSVNYSDMLQDAPTGTEVKENEPSYRPIKVNYLEREQNNRQLGEEGERLVIEYERWRLIEKGKDGLADKIEWVAKEKGDGLGFDILSRNENGTDRYIEVKTTKLSKESPIFLSRNEISFADSKRENFYLYRVFNFTDDPRLFIKQGRYESFCRLVAQTFKGHF